MKKMPCIFARAFDRGRPTEACRDEWVPGVEWVRDGEGIATRKFDGTACAIISGRLYARYDAKKGKTPPSGSIPCDPAPDEVTGHWPHWVAVEQQPEFKWHREAMGDGLPDGTYELVGPAINSNKEHRTKHELLKHGSVTYDDAPRTHSGLKEYLSRLDAEGIVFHHPDGRMAKIRRADFLLPWPSTEVSDV